MSYIPLNIKTNYELLSSLIKIDDLVYYAKKNNINALGITDSNMFSCAEFYNRCKESNIKPIIGINIEVENINFLIYAKNYKGYVNLCEIVSSKNINNIKLDFFKDTTNLICVCDLNDYSTLNMIFDLVFIKYQNEIEKNNALTVTENIVFMTEIKMFNNSDAEYLKFLYMIRDGKVISDNIDYKFDNNYFIDVDEIANTLSFSNLIDIELPIYSFDLPNYTDNSLFLLKSLCRKGLTKRLNGKVSVNYVNRLTYEINIISKMGYIDYFLIVYDFILYAKKNKILIGPGRGSAAGSLVCYSLGITEVDPLKYDLIFERFLNPDRISMPDIDVDIDDTRRDEIINYVKNKYGFEHVANIITFGTLLPKQIIRDVSKILEIPTNEVDRIIKFVKDKDTFNNLKNNVEFVNFIKRDSEYSTLIKICTKLEGLKRHTSLHAAGIVMSKDQLCKKIPLYKSSNVITTAYTMDYMEQFGLLKMDFLGLKNLSLLNEILTLIKDEKNTSINLSEISFEDKKTLEIFNKVNTVGIFQFESEGMKSFLREYKINDFNDIVNAIALYRPGPREMIPHFINRKNGKEKVEYLIPSLEPILKSTYGIMVFQEQIMQILTVIGGYTYAQADVIRRAMSKKKENIIKKEKEVFVNSGINRGYSKNSLVVLFDQIYKFSNYGFNKSHSVGYSMVAFYLAYLKSHYTEYFMISLLNSVIGRESKTKEYIDEAKLLNSHFGRLDINLSKEKYEFKNGKIIFPFGIVKNIGLVSSKEILNEREKGIFTSFYNFMIRCYQGSVTKRVIINLIELGAFDSFEINKKAYINALDKIIEYALIKREVESDLILEPVIEENEDYTDIELMEKEYNLLGFYLSNHPCSKYQTVIKVKDIKSYFDKVIEMILLVDNIKVIKTKNNEDMAFVDTSDETGRITLILFPKIFKNYYNIKKGELIKVNGKVEKRYDDYQIICNKIINIE